MDGLIEENEKLRRGLGALISAYDHAWEVNDAIIRTRKIVADDMKPWEENQELRYKIKDLEKRINEMENENKKLAKLLDEYENENFDSM